LLHFDHSTDDAIEQIVAEILKNVRANGDAAVLDYTRRFDQLDAAAMADLELHPAELQRALDGLPVAQRAALEAAARRVTAYHERQKLDSWSFTEADGTRLGQKITALDRVGLYVPGGKAAYPSSVLMNALPAKVAGVGELIMVVPTPRGEKNALVLAAACLAGVDRVFTIGGAQAVAALAYGTQTIPQVDKIVGPGNAYVAAAKRRVFGQVGIDMIAGPSEVLVIADGTANPDWIAADLLAQAEHDESAQSILITDDAGLADAVVAAVERQLSTLPRQAIAGASWRDYGAVIVTRKLADAIPLADRIAAEHLEIICEDAEDLASRVKNAGAIFIGAYTPEAIGDYVGGSNHVLPTARSARFASGLGVLDFVKRTSILKCDAASLRAIGEAAVVLGQAEGLEAHARSVSIRLNKLGA
jgi:histidinol dehydrogenase